MLRLSGVGLILCAWLGTPLAVRAQHEHFVSIWYRNGADCPDGDAFLQMLRQRAVSARLAIVGDAIDFVVTLGPNESGMSGVLERQTATGTVAIRRVDDASCAQVADALSLTVALAVQDAQPAAEARPSATLPTVEAEPRAPLERTATTQSIDPALKRDETPRVAWSMGALANLATGVAPGLALGGQLFLEVASITHEIWRPALRLGAVASYGAGERSGRDVSVRVLGGRIEASPVALGVGPLGLRPSVALDLGQLSGQGGGASGRRDASSWAALELVGRAKLPITPAFSFEAQLGVAVPVTRFELRSAGAERVVHETARVSLAARIGAVVHFP